MHVEYFQIGSHEGNTINDSLFNKDIEKKTVFLIEPVPHLFENLVNNYRIKASNVNNETNVICLNIAVSTKDGDIDFFIPSLRNDFTKFPYWADQISSINESHLTTHYFAEKLLVDKLNVPCKRLNTIINEYNITSIDFLFIDTEGHDYDILMDFDMSVVKPNHILFENRHMDGFNSKNQKYNYLLRYFQNIGYKIINENENDTLLSLTPDIHTFTSLV